MCIIGYAPKNATISDDTIKVMFENNPNGAGIMWKDGNKPIEIRKGFFDVKALLNAWHKVPTTAEKAIHCRIATAGKISSQCCHPFPVRETTGSMKERSTSTDMAFMHNGIIHLTQPPMGIKSPYSDTMMFGKEVLYPLKKSLDYPYVQDLIEDGINGSRLLIFSQHGDTVRLGSWVQEGKCFFSNSTYKKYKGYDSYYLGCSGYNYSSATNLPQKETKKEEVKEEVKKEELKAELQETIDDIQENLYSLLDAGCGQYIEEDIMDLTELEFLSTYGCTKLEATNILKQYDTYYFYDEVDDGKVQDDKLIEATIADELEKEGEQVVT